MKDHPIFMVTNHSGNSFHYYGLLLVL